MVQLPRGIDPELLISQVKNTAPYLFEPSGAQTPLWQVAPAQIVRDFAEASEKTLSHFEYFRLCLSAHYLTCATPVPTDVDNQIRRRLWPAHLPLDVALEMASLVIESRRWNLTLLSQRYTYGARGTPWEGEAISGLLGEWFTVACGAYCALKQYSSDAAKAKRQELFENIGDEVNRHSEVFGSLWRAQEGLECLKASASIAHNFGDLDRVMDMWELAVDDPLRLQFYKLGITPFDVNGKLRYLGRLWVAGELYKSPIDGGAMSLENHRYFALRKPRCLRQKPEYRIPIGPFLDDWARTVAKGLASPEGAPSADTFEVVEALKHGQTRLPPKAIGYRRALRAMSEVHAEFADLSDQPPQDVFERKWAEEALKLMDDIPSRA